MLRLKLAAIISTLLFSAVNHAYKNTICPDINLIRAEGLTRVENDIYQGLLVMHSSYYNTSEIWFFVIGSFSPWIGKEKALEKANNILKNMTSPGIPDPEVDGICYYYAGVPIVASAKKGSYSNRLISTKLSL